MMVGVWLIVLLPSLLMAQYIVDEEDRYLSNFNNLMSASYKEPIPIEVTNYCANKGNAIITQNVTISADTTAQNIISQCNSNTRCIIKQGVTVSMNANLNVGVLEVYGTLLWTDSTQTQQEQYLCAGYILFNTYSIFSMSVTQKKAYIYIKNNGVYDDRFGQRFLVADKPTSLDINGRFMRRTWSLLAKDFTTGGNSITLMHNANDMSWQVGDRIAIAPTAYRATGNAQYFFIKSINGNVIQLASKIDLSLNAAANQNFTGNPASGVQSEVINLSRNILITGDDFQNIHCGTGECTCSADISRSMCTVGLHTMFMGTAPYRINNVKVEKCGQRGILARYCMHFHEAGKCEGCVAHGNVVENSHQRGIVIHGTHITEVSNNVLYDVRGAGIYLEDGNELYNNVQYNVNICPWEFTGLMQGCTLPGTDNREADTAINQAAIWTLDHTNNFIGNRAANHFNGLFFQPSFQSDGRGFVARQICTQNTPLGRVMGNMNHGMGRFGTYFVEQDWPRHVSGSIENNGITGTNCPAFDASGNDLGFSATICDNTDYHNQFVGYYAAGDIQFLRHTSFDSINIFYSKDTKNFADGCSAQYKDSNFGGPGTMMLADGAATSIFDRVTFTGDMKMQASHHCGLGITGLLCNPVYMFQKITWGVTSTQWVDFLEEDVSGIASKNVNWIAGGMFVLSPDDIPNTSDGFFPAGYVSLTSGVFNYLLQLDGGKTCINSSSLGLGTRYNNGLLCKKTLRRLNIYSDNNGCADRGTTLKIEVFDYATKAKIAQGLMPFQYTTARKQGYAIAVVPDLSYEYVISKMDGSGIPLTWIIEFSDPVIGNRWTPDQIRLKVTGRTCPTITTSQHDRRFIWGDSLDNNFLARDRGACTQYPDMPAVNCNTQPKLAPVSCPSNCTEDCTAKNAYCDCGSRKCICEPGFYGNNCEFDICSDSRCQNGGKCTARYLGGDVSVSVAACTCPQPYQGEACESNPCNGVTCSGNGKCVSLGPNSYKCECKPPYVGEFCDQSCDGICVGSFPYMCSLTQEFSYCIKNTNLGCMYQNNSGLGSNLCCLRNCYACEKVICPIPDNDCFESSKCVNGVCLPFIQRLDGSTCHSKSWGICQSGQCVAGQAPTSLPSSSTQQTQTGSTSQQSQTQTTSQLTSQQTQTQTSSNPSQTKTNSQQTQTSSRPSQTNSQSTSKTFTTSQPNSTSIHLTNTTEDKDGLTRIDNQLEPWKIGVIAAGSAIGAAIIVFALLVLLKPSIRSKVFVKQKKLQFN
jgi:hypothetical protein